MKEATASGYYWVRTRDDGGPFMGHLGDDGWWQVRVVNQYCLYPPHLIEVLSDRIVPPKPARKAGYYWLRPKYDSPIPKIMEWDTETERWRYGHSRMYNPDEFDVLSDRLEPPEC